MSTQRHRSPGRRISVSATTHRAVAPLDTVDPVLWGKSLGRSAQDPLTPCPSVRLAERQPERLDIGSLCLTGEFLYAFQCEVLRNNCFVKPKMALCPRFYTPFGVRCFGT
ncbi:MAG: hypothetical protein ACRDTE_31195, partial [Pseudonocardiaceae bacterium]